MKYIKRITLLLISCTVLLNGCEEDEVPFYTGENSANFWDHVKNHSLFGADRQQLPQDTVVVNIAVIGEMTDYDRPVKGVAKEDEPGTEAKNKLTTATPDQYEILGGVVPANSLNGTFKIVVKNPDLLGEPGKQLKLRVEMAPNEHFGHGMRENNYLNLLWSREILQPATWNAMRFFFCATYSTQVYKVFMEVTGLKEFYYYQGVISEAEGRVMGKKFADRIRAMAIEQGSPILHDDGTLAGTPIQTIY